MKHSKKFLDLSALILRKIDAEKIEKIIKALQILKKKKGRLFFLGVGGSGANCSHAVNDFRKLCQIEAYSPIDNVAEITARTNDAGWHTVFEEWLKISKLSKNDCIFILSVCCKGGFEHSPQARDEGRLSRLSAHKTQN